MAETSRGNGYCDAMVEAQLRENGRRRRVTMKTFTVAAVMLALLAAPVHAQTKRPQTDEKKKEQKAPEIDEQAYKAALERIPESKEKYDPWGVARPVDSAKKSK
jgi:hypothetical protein